eukprot:TRINITY_DN4304_c0_g1_i1.p3 TRINITY_DN4304_c0_g1~~TRINITY_DN4304_c0_g1_i1.p3  ORF type:complete len:130 (+),score=28.45 TRINITY_DN4304_c0_g1_i1:407-796(+)
MSFNLETATLLYEVRYERKSNKENYTYEYLYKDIQGRYFIHFEGGKDSDYRIKVGHHKYQGRTGDYFIDELDADGWKFIAQLMKHNYPNEYAIIAVSYTHLRAHETGRNLVCRLLLEKKKKKKTNKKQN